MGVLKGNDIILLRKSIDSANFDLHQTNGEYESAFVTSWQHLLTQKQ